MARQITEREQWFIDRIGKRVFRNSDGCDCPICKSIYQNGLVIENRLQATDLYEIELSFNADGCPLRHFDTKQDVIDFENSLNK